VFLCVGDKLPLNFEDSTSNIHQRLAKRIDLGEMSAKMAGDMRRIAGRRNRYDRTNFGDA
jgi:hypothetical protein